jgi:cytochrome c2
LVLAIAAILSLTAVVDRATAGSPAPAKGKEIFLAQKCNMCHSISVAGIEATTKSEKMKGPDLTGVVEKKGAEWTTKYLTKQVDMNDKKHGKEVKLSPEEMKDLLDWLAAQKKPA